MDANSLPNSFNLTSFIAMQRHAVDSNRTRYERDIARLTRAAWGVGGTHAYFRALPRAQQEAKVSEWTLEALEHAQNRRDEMAQTV
jgi:tRNA A37 N6-isopentenylltransferase MiaA